MAPVIVPVQQNFMIEKLHIRVPGTPECAVWVLAEVNSVSCL